jgi:hypothetical protein
MISKLYLLCPLSHYPPTPNRPQHNRIRKFIASPIACTAECHIADMSLSPRYSLSPSYRSIHAGAFDSFARLRTVFADAKGQRQVVSYIDHGAVT